jgi:hypothetical protein
MTEDKALDKALEALETCDGGTSWADPYQRFDKKLVGKAIIAIKQARSAPTSADYAMGYAEGFNDGCKPAPVQEPVGWNKRIIESVDSLLAQAGFEPDSSVRHQLAMMNFDVNHASVLPEKWRNVLPGGRGTDQWESVRVADFNKGWNEYRKAAKAALEKLEATHPAQPAPVPLTDGVNVPLTILEAAEASLGSFCSDHGWSDKDMQNMDNLSAYIAQHKAAHGIK